MKHVNSIKRPLTFLDLVLGSVNYYKFQRYMYRLVNAMESSMLINLFNRYIHSVNLFNGYMYRDIM
jgi:hypothetical protein